MADGALMGPTSTVGCVGRGVLEISNFISELFSLLLLQDPSVFLLRFMDSIGSLLFSAIISA